MEWWLCYYGYTLEDNKLMIEETEAVAIRKILNYILRLKSVLGGIANQLNLQGIRKIPRQNGTLGIGQDILLN